MAINITKCNHTFFITLTDSSCFMDDENGKKSNMIKYIVLYYKDIMTALTAGINKFINR